MELLQKQHLNDLQTFMRPANSHFTVIDVIERFPRSASIHDLFRKACIYYEQPTLTFKMINEFILLMLTKEQSDCERNGRKGQRIHVMGGESGCKVCLLASQQKGQNQKSQGNEQQNMRETDSIKRHRITGAIVAKSDNNSEEQNIFVMTNSFLKQFSATTLRYSDDSISVSRENIKLADVRGEVVGIITRSNSLYLQAQPSALKNVMAKQNRDTSKLNVTQKLIFKIEQEEDIIFMSAFSWEKWVICSSSSIWIVHICLKSSISAVEPQINKIDVRSKLATQTQFSLRKKTNGLILKSLNLNDQYLLLMTSEQSLLLFDTESLKFTNRIYNDINFADFCYNPRCRLLLASDYAGYLMSMSFNPAFADFEEEGISFKKSTQQQVAPNKEKKSKQRFQPLNTAKKLFTDPPLSKQRKTPYTNIILNVHRTVMQLVVSRQQSVFTYQDKGSKLVKIWDAVSLHHYQSITLNQSISSLNICSDGLLAISTEKSYLSFFKFEKYEGFGDKKQVFQISSCALNSNSLLVEAQSVQQTVFYKLKLRNTPQLWKLRTTLECLSSDKLNVAFLKTQILFLDTSKPNEHRLQIFSRFGQLKEIKRSGYEQFTNMIAMNKGSVLFWGPNKMMIRHKKKILINERSETNHRKQSREAFTSTPYFQTIDFQKTTMVFAIFWENLITVGMKPQNTEYEGLQVCVIDPRTFRISSIVQNIPQQVKILNSHKEFILFYQQHNQLYWMYDFSQEKIIWKSQPNTKLDIWSLETVETKFDSDEKLSIIIIYKSKQLIKCSEPLFMVELISFQKLAKPGFSSLQLSGIAQSVKSSGYLRADGSRTFAEILSRSMFRKFTYQALRQSEFCSSALPSQCFRIFLPDYLIKSNIKRLTESDFHRLEGKILGYVPEQNCLAFGLLSGGVLSLYALTQKTSESQVIGVVDLNIERSEEQIEDMIVEWNEQYKQQQELQWQHIVKDVSTMVEKKRFSKLQINPTTRSVVENPETIAVPQTPKSPEKFRRYKTEVKHSDEEQSENELEKIINKINNKKVHSESSRKNNSINAKAVNNLFYKGYIQDSIKEERYEHQNPQKLSRKVKSYKKIGYNEVKQIQQLTKAVKRSKVTELTPMIYENNPDLRAKSTQSSLTTSKKSEKLIGMHAVSRKTRYETEAMQQLESSKIVEKLILPSMQKARTLTLNGENNVKSYIYDILKSQTLPLQKSRNIISKMK